MTNTILVTGATGKVGQEVVRQLVQRGDVQVRAAVTNPAEARAKLGDLAEGVQFTPFDFHDTATHAPALEGVSRLFLMRPPAISNARIFVPILDAAKVAGVEQVVFLSLQGAEKNPVVPHARIEKAIIASDLPYVFLRPSFFMQNLSTTHREEIRRGEIFVPAGGGKTSFVDVRDIGAIGALALTSSVGERRAHTLTGSEALSYAEVAALLTEVLGKSVRYTRPSLPRFIFRKRREGLPWGFILVMSGIYTTCALGLAAGVSPEIEHLLGRPAITLRQFIEDYRAVWL